MCIVTFHINLDTLVIIGPKKKKTISMGEWEIMEMYP
jgi:hypothetical protein